MIDAVVQLFAQVADMHVDGVVGFAEVFVAPYPVEQLFGTDDVSFILAKYA